MNNHCIFDGWLALHRYRQQYSSSPSRLSLLCSEISYDYYTHAQMCVKTIIAHYTITSTVFYLGVNKQQRQQQQLNKPITMWFIISQDSSYLLMQDGEKKGEDWETDRSKMPERLFQHRTDKQRKGQDRLWIYERSDTTTVSVVVFVLLSQTFSRHFPALCLIGLLSNPTMVVTHWTCLLVLRTFCNSTFHKISTDAFDDTNYTMTLGLRMMVLCSQI